MSFPMASRPIAGIKVQTGVDCAMGLHNFTVQSEVSKRVNGNQ